jgi:hypothetical protein
LLPELRDHERQHDGRDFVPSGRRAYAYQQPLRRYVQSANAAGFVMADGLTITVEVENKKALKLLAEILERSDSKLLSCD